MPPVAPTLSACAAIVRRADPDRFLTALFAPAAVREALFTLYAFNDETARAREVASQPIIALIRLQWWREVVEGTAKHHEVATPLTALLQSGALDPADLLAVLDAREVTEVSTLADWLDWLRTGAGSLAMAAGRLLGAPDPRLRDLGAGYAAAGVLRSTVALARAGICLLPADVLARHGLSADAVIADPLQPALHPAVSVLMQEGRTLLRHKARLGPALAAGLPAVLGRRDLRQTPAQLLQPRKRGVLDQLAVTIAAASGRA